MMRIGWYFKDFRQAIEGAVLNQRIRNVGEETYIYQVDTGNDSDCLLICNESLGQEVAQQVFDAEDMTERVEAYDENHPVVAWRKTKFEDHAHSDVMVLDSLDELLAKGREAERYLEDVDE